MRIAVLASLLFVLVASVFAETIPPPSSLDSIQFLINLDDAKEAIPILEKIVASDPASAPRALLLMSECYDLLEKWSEALDCIEKVQKTYPDSIPNTDIKLRLMDHYLAQGVMDKFQSLRQELASEFQSDAWQVYYTVGKRRCLRHEYAEAIPELKRAVELGEGFKDPGVADANYWLLHCFREQKQWAEVEKLGPLLIQRYPSIEYMIQMEIGRGYREQKKHDEAIEHLETAARLCPKEDYYNLSFIERFLLDCYADTSKLDKAIPLAEQLNRDYPDDSDWQWRLGWYYVIRKDYGKAVPLFQQVIKSSSKRWEIRKAQIFLGQCMFKLGQGKQAMDMVESYFKNKPELWDEHLLVKGGVLFYGPNDFEACIATEKQLVDQAAAGRRSDLVPTARELMYKALNRTGDLGEAAPVLETMARDAGNPEWLCQAGEDYFKAGNYAEARRVYKEAMNTPDASASVKASGMYGLALCYWESGLKDAARRLMQELVEKYPNTAAGQKARGALYLWSKSKE